MNPTSAHLCRYRLGGAATATLAGIFLLLFSQLPVTGVAAKPHAQDGTIVRCDPSTVIGSIDQTLTVDLYVQGVTNLYGLDLRTRFDATVAQVIDEVPGTAGVQFLPVSSFLHPDYVARNVVDNSAGTIRYATTQTAPTAPVTGSGPVARIRFTALRSGQLAMTFTSRELVDRYGVGIYNVAGGCDIAFEAPTAVSPRELKVARVSLGGRWAAGGLGVVTTLFWVLRRQRHLH